MDVLHGTRCLFGLSNVAHSQLNSWYYFYHQLVLLMFSSTLKATFFFLLFKPNILESSLMPFTCIHIIYFSDIFKIYSSILYLALHSVLSKWCLTGIITLVLLCVFSFLILLLNLLPIHLKDWVYYKINKVILLLCSGIFKVFYLSWSNSLSSYADSKGPNSPGATMTFPYCLSFSFSFSLSLWITSILSTLTSSSSQGFSCLQMFMFAFSSARGAFLQEITWLVFPFLPDLFLFFILPENQL